MTSNKNEITVTKEEMANIITSCIIGFIAGVTKVILTDEMVDKLKKDTLESVEESDGFLQEMKNLKLIRSIVKSLVKEPN